MACRSSPQINFTPVSSASLAPGRLCRVCLPRLSGGQCEQGERAALAPNTRRKSGSSRVPTGGESPPSQSARVETKTRLSWQVLDSFFHERVTLRSRSRPGCPGPDHARPLPRRIVRLRRTTCDWLGRHGARSPVGSSDTGSCVSTRRLKAV